MKILITNYGNRLNKGTAAILHSQVKALKDKFSEAEFWVLTYYPELENYLKKDYVKFFKIAGRFSRRRLLTNFKTLIAFCECLLWRFFNFFGMEFRLSESLERYRRADLIIDTGGDGLTEDYGTPVNIVINLLFGILLEKPVVIYAESIGSFKKWYNRAMVKFLLDRARLITLRDEISVKNVKDLKVKKQAFLTADPAFLLECAPEGKIEEILKIEKISKEAQLIGISASQLFSRSKFSAFASARKQRDYIEAMAKTIDYLADTTGANIVFIPHVIDEGNDDRDMADKIIALAKNKEKIISIRGEYTPEETKGIIAKCSIFIGARMHACIASTSMAVPTVAIAYSHKTPGIIGKMLGYEDFVINLGDMNFDALSKAADMAWKDRKKISAELLVKMEKIKELSLLNAELVEIAGLTKLFKRI